MNISVRQAMIRGERHWCVDARSIGKGRQFVASEREANRIAAQMRSEISGGWVALTEDERRELYQLRRDAAADGVTLAEVVRQWRTGIRAQAAVPQITH